MHQVTIHTGGNKNLNLKISFKFCFALTYYINLLFLLHYSHRGYIWININYLTLSALSHYKIHSSSPIIRERCQLLYTRLRDGLIQNVLRQYERTGYLWEQYDDISGIGIRGHPFTGWTVLILNIMTEKY